jgi:hypothetical protein
MDIDTTTIIISAVLLVGVLIYICFAYLRRRLQTKRVMMMDLLKGYFKGDVPVDELRPRTREMVSQRFTGSTEFYSLAIAAFQGAVDAKLAQQGHTEEDEKKLLRLLAALKNEFGLTDRYQIEGWRAGRE